MYITRYEAGKFEKKKLLMANLFYTSIVDCWWICPIATYIQYTACQNPYKQDFRSQIIITAFLIIIMHDKEWIKL